MMISAKLLWLSKQILSFIFYFVPFLLLFLILVLNHAFNSPSYEQLVFFFQFGTQNPDHFDNTFFVYHLLKASMFAVPSTILCMAIIFFLSRGIAKNRFANTVKSLLKYTPVAILLVAIVTQVNMMGFWEYYKKNTIEKDPFDYFGANYVDPKEVSISPSSKNKNGIPKNIVIVYVESLEFAFTNKEMFGRNLLEPLTSLGGTSFSSFKQTGGSQGSIPGIVATQCGLHTKPIFTGATKREAELLKKFIPGATCLSDTLSQFGFISTHLASASIRFAGLENFLDSHSFDAYTDKWGWIKSGKYSLKNMNEWGLNDHDLMAEAAIKLDQLQAEGKPFLLSMLTSDTHGPKGFLSPKCKAAGGVDYRDIVQCTARAVRKFVDHAIEKGYLENTAILILGDHIARPTEGIAQLNTIGKQDRDIFNLWLGDPFEEKNRENIIAYDFPASLLNFIGMEVKGGRYGLGYDAFGNAATPPESRVQELEENLMNPSSLYKQLWLADRKLSHHPLVRQELR